MQSFHPKPLLETPRPHPHNLGQMTASLNSGMPFDDLAPIILTFHQRNYSMRYRPELDFVLRDINLIVVSEGLKITDSHH